ncbi:hypothetical protein AVEN_47849-1 [Araneus ventricosus]|uniref:Uncharacterized protein n=1 Tax=Araneus ventricosus TaxID=182803 RepID=A0A4Y2BJE4_ARAVE|nr:hypothetical protein AVEN_47849-1 [Araneus ventricosus]
MYIKGTSSNQDFYVMYHHHGSPHTNHWHVGPSPFSCSLVASSSIISKKNYFLPSSFLTPVKMEANAKDMSILEVYDSDTLQDRDIEAPLPPLDTHKAEAPSVDTPPFETSICKENTQQNNLAIDDDFLGKVVRQGRSRTSSTSSVTASESTGAASMNNIFDNNAH